MRVGVLSDPGHLKDTGFTHTHRAPGNLDTGIIRGKKGISKRPQKHPQFYSHLAKRGMGRQGRERSTRHQSIKLLTRTKTQDSVQKQSLCYVK